jgi:protein arginine kinase activator
VINGKKIEAYLCEQCANEKSQYNFGHQFDINSLFSGLMGFSEAVPHIETAQQKPVCDKCGMSYEEFQKTGKLGCSDCYSIFGDMLKPLLKRVHGNIEHNGKIPGSVSQNIKVSKEIEKLKESLNKAIQSEEYEKAAEIRDQIKGLEVES